MKRPTELSLQFRDLRDPIGKFERLFRAALKSLLRDLADAPWYVREREVVNLFVFRHLVPQFKAKKLDIGQIGIEVPVQKLPETGKALGVYADIAVWLHIKATVWRTCKPLAHIEWKNISCREEDPGKLMGQHEEDIRHLHRDRQFAYVGYAVLRDQRDRHVKVQCKRISDGRDPEDFFSTPRTHAATCPESAITELQGSYRKVRSRPQACKDCIAPKASRGATGRPL